MLIESSNIASQKEIGSISGNINLKHIRYTHLLASWNESARVTVELKKICELVTACIISTN